jgi:hypothetical protein
LGRIGGRATLPGPIHTLQGKTVHGGKTLHGNQEEGCEEEKETLTVGANDIAHGPKEFQKGSREKHLLWGFFNLVVGSWSSVFGFSSSTKAIVCRGQSTRLSMKGSCAPIQLPVSIKRKKR